MRTIAMVAQKGGVGKTTLAVNLAVAAEAAGVRTAVADLDPQESATTWSERRTGDSPHVEPLSARRLPAWLTAAKGSGFGLAILDTPPAAGPEALDAVRLADLVLVPCRPSLIDLEAIRRTAQLVTLAGKPGCAVINAAPVSARALIADALHLIEGTGFAVTAPIIRERAVWRHAWPLGQGVLEHEPHGKAADELRALLAFTLEMLQNVKPERIDIG